MKQFLAVLLLTACSIQVQEPLEVDTPIDQPPIEQPPSKEPIEEPKLYSVDLSWEAPTERENGETLFIYEIGGYEIRYRTDLEYEYLYISDGSVENLTVINLQPLKYYFSINAYDVDGLYSDYTNEEMVDLR